MKMMNEFLMKNVNELNNPNYSWGWIALSRLKFPALSEITIFAFVHNFNIPINFAVVIGKCVYAKYAIKYFISVDVEVISREEKYHRFPECWIPARLRCECDWFNTLTENNIKICDECADVCVTATFQTKWGIKPSIVALFHRIHIQMLD